MIELAERYAPANAAAIRKLAREKYFDASFVIRSQDNYVVQWARPGADERAKAMASVKLKGEFSRRIDAKLPFTRLAYPDTYAPEVGFSDGFPVARDPKKGETWLTHCYGSVGVGRDNDADSGNGSELYAVIGQSPRGLDRNITVVGRVVRGIELFSVMPRGSGAMGFYEKPEQYIPIREIARRGGRSGRAAHEPRGVEDRERHLQGVGRFAGDAQGGVVQGADRAHRRVQRDACRARQGELGNDPELVVEPRHRCLELRDLVLELDHVGPDRRELARADRFIPAAGG